jgi:hypothetical protein
VTPEPSRRRFGGVLGALSVVALVAAGVVLALVLTRGGDDGTEPGPGAGLLPTAPASLPVTTRRSTATKPLTRPGSWPVGATGWTVVLATLAKKAHRRAAAERRAAAVQVPGLVARVLDSSQHPKLRPAVWIIYVGRYPTRARAERTARQLGAAGVRRGVVERLTG